jgi:hypothetical protein
MMGALFAVGVASVICFALMAHVQNRSRQRSRAGAAADGGDSCSGTSDGFSLGSWFSSNTVDSSGGPTDSGSCSFSSGAGSGDCGGGGDSGGGGGGD